MIWPRAPISAPVSCSPWDAPASPRVIIHEPSSSFSRIFTSIPRDQTGWRRRFHLGEAQRQAGQLAQARLTWTDLARLIERAGAAPLPGDAQAVRALALAEIPTTYGIPNPPNDTSLNLGVAALERFLAAYPAHPKAVRGAYEIGVSYLARGKSDQALAAFSRFLKGEGFRVETDEARRDRAELVMTATFQYGQILQGQEKFAEAIAAWKGYLAKFPNGPQSADAQRAILDTQLLIAADHLRRERYPEARAAWSEFVAANPLDPRVAKCSSRSARASSPRRSSTRRSPPGVRCPASFPSSEPAAHAQFLTASIFETEKGDPAAAIERFKKIAVEPWRSQAQQRIAVMEVEGPDGPHPAHFPNRRDRGSQDHDPEPREAHVHRLQAEPRGLLPQEARARERRVARHRPGRPRRRVDGPGSRLSPGTSRSRRATS